MKIVLIVAGFVIVSAVLYLASPWMLARRVTFVIPDDFRGLVRVYSSSVGRPFHGTVAVPANGEIPASDVSGQPEAQRIKARWQSGGELEMKYIGDQTADKVFLWIMAVRSRVIGIFVSG
jgi:hypothetical protein